MRFGGRRDGKLQIVHRLPEPIRKKRPVATELALVDPVQENDKVGPVSAPEKLLKKKYFLGRIIVTVSVIRYLDLNIEAQFFCTFIEYI